MRGGDDSRVDFGCLRAAQPLDLLVFQDAQQLDLDLERQVADLIEEDRRSVGELEAPGLTRQSACVGAFLPAEQLTFDQGRREWPRS